MKRRPHQPRTRDGYHHGDLRRALLDAAAALVEEKGLEALSMREVARRAGVSHAAPYHHFHDLAALVAALAIEGLQGLERVLRDETARLAAGAPAAARLRALGLAYVRYAASDPARFRLMFRPELCGAGAAAAVEAAGREAYSPVLEAAADGAASGEFAAGDAEDLALAAWAEVHGIATLLIDGPLYHQAGDPEAAEALAGRAIDRLLAGLLAR